MSFPAELSNPLEVYAGDDFDVTVAFYANGAPSVLAGELRAHVRPVSNPGEPEEFTVERTDNMVTLRLTREQTRKDLSGKWDLELTTPDDKVRTLLRGKVAWMEDITR